MSTTKAGGCALGTGQNPDVWCWGGLAREPVKRIDLGGGVIPAGASLAMLGPQPCLIRGGVLACHASAGWIARATVEPARLIGSSDANLCVAGERVVQCWGHVGELELSGEPVTFAAGISELVVGVGGVCVALVSGAVSCLGMEYGGIQRWVTLPVGDAVHVGMSGGDVCVSRNGGGVWCSDGPELDLPAVAKLVGGFGHLCALSVDGSVRCWSGRTRPDAPVFLGARDIWSGVDFTCAAGRDYATYCWGRPAPLIANDAPTPVPVCLGAESAP